MGTVIVEVPDSSGQAHSRYVELEPGDEVTFGRGAPDCPVDIPLPDPGVSRLAGRVHAVEDYWLVSNLSRDRTYVVENPEGGGEFVKVTPRRLEMPVPFEFARVVVPAVSGQVSFMAFAPQHTYADDESLEQPRSEQTLAVFPLDETAKYFLVLVALCEHRLRDSSAVAIPTVPEIVQRLQRLDSCRDLTRSAVNFHIEYLARSKLRVKQPSVAGEGAKDSKADWQREALVSLALRFNLVREDHLALLPARPRDRGRETREQTDAR